MSKEIKHSHIQDASLLHQPFHYQQSSDPGAIGAGLWWLDPTVVGTLVAGNLLAGPTSALVRSDTKYNAFPDITQLPNGHLLIGYRSGVDHASVDGVLKSQVSTNLGATWSAPATVYSGAQDARDCGLCLLPNNHILWAFTETDDATVWKVYVLDGTPSGDSVSWSSKILVDDSTHWDGGGPVTSGRPLHLANGSILLPLYGWKVGDTWNSAGVCKSTNNGATWGAPVIVARDSSGTLKYTEANAVQLGNGDVVMIVRVNSVGFLRSVSTDNGATWTAPTQVIADTNPGRPSPLLLNSGRIAMFTRQVNGGGGWTVSDDNGVTWTAFTQWSANLHVYAGMTQLPSGVIGAATAEEISSTDARVHYQDLLEPPSIGYCKINVRNSANTAWITL